MTYTLKTLRYVFLVCALPLAVTAVLSAETFFNTNTSIVQEYVDALEVENLEVPSTPAGQVLDVDAQISHALFIDGAGGVSGQLFARSNNGHVGLTGMKATLNSQGQVVAEAMTNEAGQFRFDSVAPGAYTFIASSESSITTFGVYVYENEAMAPAANDVQLTVAAAGMNTPAVREVLNSEVQSVSYSYTPSQEELPVAQELSQVNQAADGSVSGRVVPLQWLAAQSSYNLQGNQVYLFNEAGMAHQVAVDAQGYYQIENVNPGIYDFVSFGPHGAAALSIQVNAHDNSVASTSETGFSLASSRAVVQDDFGVVLGEPVSGGGGTPSVDVEVIVNQPTGGFAPGPGGYGGGGYGGLGGDWGGIIGAALGAWVLTEIIDSNNNNNNGGVINPPVVVPPVVIPPVVSPTT